MRERAEAALAVFGNHAPYLFTLVLVAQLPILALALAGTVLGPSGAVLNLLAFVLFLGSMPLWTGALMVSLGRINQHGEIDIAEAYRLSADAYRFLVPVYVLCMVAVFAGTLLLIVPGIFLGLRLCLSPFVALFEKLEGREALRRSWHMTSSRMGELLVYFVVAVFPGMVLQFLGNMMVSVEPAPALLALFNFVAQLTSLTTSLLLMALLYQVYVDVSRVEAKPVLSGEVLFKPIKQGPKRLDEDE